MTSNSWTITHPHSAVELEDGPPSPPVHPGEILLFEFMEPLGLDPERVAAGLGLPVEAIDHFLAGRTSVTPELALRLEHAFAWNADMWMRLQAYHDLEQVRRQGDVVLDHLPVLHAAE
jgi:addiction module HigA family antidote